MSVLLSVRDGHEKFLMDRLSDGLRANTNGNNGKEAKEARAHALNVLGCVVRKAPPWLYKVRKMLKFAAKMTLWGSRILGWRPDFYVVEISLSFVPRVQGKQKCQKMDLGHLTD